MRASGEPYVLHPLEVAHVLAEMKLDSTAIAAGPCIDTNGDHTYDGKDLLTFAVLNQAAHPASRYGVAHEDRTLGASKLSATEGGSAVDAMVGDEYQVSRYGGSDL